MAYEYAGVNYENKAMARRASLYGWCEDYGDTVGEQAHYVNDNLDECAEEMAKEWVVPFLDEEDAVSPEVYRELLMDFVKEQGIIS